MPQQPELANSPPATAGEPSQSSAPQQHKRKQQQHSSRSSSNDKRHRAGRAQAPRERQRHSRGLIALQPDAGILVVAHNAWQLRARCGRDVNQRVTCQVRPLTRREPASAIVPAELSATTYDQEHSGKPQNRGHVVPRLLDPKSNTWQGQGSVAVLCITIDYRGVAQMLPVCRVTYDAG